MATPSKVVRSLRTVPRGHAFAAKDMATLEPFRAIDVLAGVAMAPEGQATRLNADSIPATIRRKTFAFKTTFNELAANPSLQQWFLRQLEPTALVSPTQGLVSSNGA